MIDQDIVHDKTFSPLSSERIEAMEQLSSSFESVPDREQAFEDMLRLSSDKCDEVRESAVSSLSTVFSKLPESGKIQVWERFINLTAYPSEEILKAAAQALVSVFPHNPNKENAWEDLMELVNSNSSFEDVRTGIIRSLPTLCPHIPDRKKAYSDLVHLAEKEDSDVLRELIENPDSINPQFPEEDLEKDRKECEEKGRISEEKSRKECGEKESIEEGRKESEKKLIGKKKLEKKSEKKEVGKPERFHDYEPSSEKAGAFERARYLRKDATEFSAGSYPANLPNKKEVVAELIRLNSDPDPSVRRGAMDSLLALYSRKQGKMQDIWGELLERTEDGDSAVRKETAELLSHVLPGVEEKAGVFFDLVRLASGQDTQLRKRAAELFSAAFSHAEDKKMAWGELVRLASSEDREVRRGAAKALALAYPEVPDKGKAWKDLVRLSGYSDSFVQRAAARTLTPAFFHVPDKTGAWRDLKLLIEDPYTYVRKYAFRALARASLWRSLKAENEATYIYGLKEAAGYFKEASEIPFEGDTPEFYRPFYEAYLYIIVSDRPLEKARLETKLYLSKAAREARDLEEKRKLLDKGEKFAELLQAVGKLSPEDLPARKKMLETCILEFDRATELFENTEEEAITAKKIVKKEYPKIGKVLLEQKLKETLSGIRYKARITCLKAKGTPAENLACTVSLKVRGWKFEALEKDRKELDRQLESLLNVLRSKIPFVPENMYIFEKIEDIRQEEDLLERYKKVARLVSLIPEARMPSRR